MEADLKQIQEINEKEAELETFGALQDAEFKALGTTNMFTGEPLDSDDPMDPTQQGDNKNPSYNQRQNTKEQSQSKATQWNAQQKTKTSFGAAVASSIGNFLDDVGDYAIGELRGIKDITNLDFSDRNKLSNSWSKVGYALGVVGGFVGSVASGEEEIAFGMKGAEESVAAELNASNHINSLRLNKQLTIEQASSIFIETGGLTSEVDWKFNIENFWSKFG